MKSTLIFSDLYSRQLQLIEDHIYDTSNEIRSVELFLDGHDHALKFIDQNPNIPAKHFKTGYQSWPFSNGRYRLFFKHEYNSSLDKASIYFITLIDNRMLNLRIYPENSFPTFGDE